MKNARRKSELGFTLVEILVAGAIMASLVYGMSSAMTFFGRSAQSTKVTAEFTSLVGQIQSVLINSSNCQTVLAPYSINPGASFPQALGSAITTNGTSTGIVIVPIPPNKYGATLAISKLEFSSASPIGSSTTQYLSNLHLEATKIVGGGGAIGSPKLSHDFQLTVTLNASHQIVGCSGTGDSIWQRAANGTDIYYNGGMVGIGTNTPGQFLDIEQSIDNEAGVRIANTSTGGGAYAQYEVATGPSGGAFGIRGQGVGPWGAMGPNAVFLYGFSDTFIGTTGATTNLVFINGSTPTERMRMDANGRFGIENPSPASLLHVGSASTGAGIAVASFQSASGTCTMTPSGSGSGMACSSDERLKEGFQSVSPDDALNRLLNLQAYSYHFKAGPKSSRQTGFKAQDLQKLIPELVTKGSDGYLQVYYDGLIPWMTEALKALDSRQKALEAENSELRARLEKLEAMASKQTR